MATANARQSDRTRVFVAVISVLLNVRSPPPPVVALVGLAGILLGEQIVPLGKRLIAGETMNLAAVAEHSRLLGGMAMSTLRTTQLNSFFEHRTTTAAFILAAVLASQPSWPVVK
jgi:XapX domain-containing protein